MKITGRSIRLTKLDADGQPTGESVTMNADATVSLQPVRRLRVKLVLEPLTDRGVGALFGADTLAAVRYERDRLAYWENEGGAL